jgi:molybdopterin-guanine dinucleotide biosynthesis protein A
MKGQDPLNPPAVILAGGLSRRMGHDKAGVMLGGRSLLDHVVARLLPQVSAIALNAHPDVHAPHGLPVIADVIAGHRGPLAGILTAMRHGAEQHAHASHVLTVPIDSPFLPHDLVARLAEEAHANDAIAIAASAGTMHPVCGLWPVSLADALQAFLDGPDEPRVKTFLEGQKTALVDFPLIETAQGPLDPFINLNTPDDLKSAETFLPEAG